MDSVRKKRSQDGAGPSRRQELEETLAALRDQEAVLKRTIELVQAGLVGLKSQPQQADAQVPNSQPRPTAEPKDYELRLRQVQEEQKRRAKAFWGDIRKLVASLKSNKSISQLFGAPVRSTPWGAVPAHWESYCKVVSEPMDLGTVKTMLGDDESRRQYKSPKDVKRHIQLIVDNARTFNEIPLVGTPQVLEFATNLEQAFHKKWHDGAFESRWQSDLARQKLEEEELADLKLAAHGTIADKIRYFDNCVRRRLAELHTAEPAAEAPFTWEQKRKLSVACSQLDDVQCHALVDVLVKHSGKDLAGDGDILLDIGSLPTAALHELQKVVDAARGRSAPPAGAVAANATAEQPAQPPAANHTAPCGEGVMASASREPRAERLKDADAAARTGAKGSDWEAAQPENGQADAGPAANDTDVKSGAESSSSSSSSSSNASSSSSDDAGDRADNQSQQSSPHTSTGDAVGRGPKDSGSADSKQGESNHGTHGADQPLATADRENRPSGDGGETVLMSRNVPMEDKPLPQILKAASAREIEIHNAEDWEVPDEEPIVEDSEAGAATWGAAGAGGDGGEAAAADGVKHDHVWEEMRRQDAALQEKRKAEADRLAREQEEDKQRKRKRDESAAQEAEVARAAEDARRQAAERERLERIEQRKKELENEIRDPGEVEEDLEVGA